MAAEAQYSTSLSHRVRYHRSRSFSIRISANRITRTSVNGYVWVFILLSCCIPNLVLSQTTNNDTLSSSPTTESIDTTSSPEISETETQTSALLTNITETTESQSTTEIVESTATSEVESTGSDVTGSEQTSDISSTGTESGTTENILITEELTSQTSGITESEESKTAELATTSETTVDAETTTSIAPSKTSPVSPGGGLSGGDIAAIVICSLVGVAVIAVCIYLLRNHLRRKQSTQYDQFDMSSTSYEEY